MSPLAARLPGLGLCGRAVRLPRALPGPERLRPRAGSVPAAPGGGAVRLGPVLRQPPRYGLPCPGALYPCPAVPRGSVPVSCPAPGLCTRVLPCPGALYCCPALPRSSLHLPCAWALYSCLPFAGAPCSCPALSRGSVFVPFPRALYCCPFPELYIPPLSRGSVLLPSSLLFLVGL